MNHWKNIHKHPNYQINNIGEVKSKDRTRRLKIPKNGDMNNLVWGTAPMKGRIIKPFFDTRGRVRISIGKKKYFVSNLVASHFISRNISDGKKYVVNHIDNNPSNNFVDNLEWVSQKENIAHSIRQGRHSSVTRWKK